MTHTPIDLRNAAAQVVGGAVVDELGPRSPDPTRTTKGKAKRSENKKDVKLQHDMEEIEKLRVIGASDMQLNDPTLKDSLGHYSDFIETRFGEPVNVPDKVQVEDTHKVGFMDYVDSFNKGMGKSPEAVVNAISHPKNTVKRIGDFFGKLNQPLPRPKLNSPEDLQRLKDFYMNPDPLKGLREEIIEFGKGFIHANGLKRTEMISSLLPGLVLGPAFGEGAAALLPKVGIFTPKAGKVLDSAESAEKSSNLLQDVLENAKQTPGKPNQLEVVLDDGSKVIFRRDIGEHAHPIGKEYPNPTDHYNIEIQAANPARPGKFTQQENVHVVVDENLHPIDIFLKDKTRIIINNKANKLKM